MKKYNGGSLLSTIFIIIAIAIAIFGIYRISHRVKTTNEIKPDTYEWCVANGGKSSTESYNSLKSCLLNDRVYSQNCVGDDAYFVISKDKNDMVGSNILIKKKSSSNQSITCEYTPAYGDFQITDEFADYVLALENNLLILDEGTGPSPRGLVIYNLDTSKKVYTGIYSTPIDIENNSIYYWSGTKTPVTTENCPDSKEWEKDGLGSAIEEYVSLDLTTLTETKLGQFRCSARQ